MNNVSALLLSFACAALLSLRLLGLAVPHLRCRFLFCYFCPFAEPLAIGAVSAVGRLFYADAVRVVPGLRFRTPVPRLGQPGCDGLFGSAVRPLLSGLRERGGRQSVCFSFSL